MMKFLGCNILCFVLLLSIFSCGTDELSGEINISNLTPSLGVPVGSVDYTLESLISDLTDTSAVSIDPNVDVITLIFSDTLESFGNLNEFVDFDQSIDGQDDVSSPLTFGSDSIETAMVTDTLEYAFELEQEEIVKEISYLTGGTSRLVIIPTAQGNVSLSNLTLTFTTITNKTDETPLVVTFNDTLNNVSTIEEISLGDFKSVFELDSNNNPLSSIIVNMDVSSPFGEIVNAGQDLLSLSITYADIEYESVVGYFGQKSVTLSEESIDFSFFNEISSNAITFTSPRASISAETNIGIPLGFDLRGTRGVRGEATVPLEPNNEEDTVVITEGPSMPGEVSTVSVDISPSNDGGFNLDEVFKLAPTEFVTSIVVSSNPGVDASDPPLTNFITNDGFADPIVDIRLPFRVIIDSLSIFLNRELDINENFDEVTSAALRIKSINRIPLVGVVYMDILQGTNVLSTLSLGDTVIAAPRLSASFEVSEASEKETLIELSREDLDNLSAGDNFTIRVVADTKVISETRAVDMNKDASLVFNVSLIANTTIDL